MTQSAVTSRSSPMTQSLYIQYNSNVTGWRNGSLGRSAPTVLTGEESHLHINASKKVLWTLDVCQHWLSGLCGYHPCNGLLELWKLWRGQEETVCTIVCLFCFLCNFQFRSLSPPPQVIFCSFCIFLYMYIFFFIFLHLFIFCVGKFLNVCMSLSLFCINIIHH